MPDHLSYSHGQVSNDPIFPTDESMKLYGALMVLLKNSKVARGHPSVWMFSDCFSTL